MESVASIDLLGPRGVLWRALQPLLFKALFSTHDVKNKDSCSIKTVKNGARWFDDLAVWRAWQFSDDGTALWVFLELPNMGEDPLNECFCCVRFVECDVVGDSLQIAQCGFCPD